MSQVRPVSYFTDTADQVNPHESKQNVPKSS